MFSLLLQDYSEQKLMRKYKFRCFDYANITKRQPLRQPQKERSMKRRRIGALREEKWSRQESNLDLEFRKLLFYPLNYGTNVFKNSFPMPDLKYFSLFLPDSQSTHSSTKITFQGRYAFVDLVLPALCSPNLTLTSFVIPT